MNKKVAGWSEALWASGRRALDLQNKMETIARLRNL